MIKKFAFSFIEVAIVLTIIGSLSALFLISYNKSAVNKKKVLFKKAYYVAERAVYDIINDEDLYPSAGSAEGLKNTASAEYNDNIYEGDSKFCELFASKLNTVSKNPDCSHDHDFSKGPSFVTTDGIAWYLPVFDLKNKTDGDKDSPAEYHIWVDVDNQDGVNSFYSDKVCETAELEEGEEEPKQNCHNEVLTEEPDRFKIKVLYNGKIYVDGQMEKKYLESNTITSK